MSYFEEEAQRKIKLIRQAFEEKRMIYFRWHADGSGCEFHYKGIDRHGLPATFLSSLNAEHSIQVFSAFRITL